MRSLTRFSSLLILAAGLTLLCGPAPSAETMHLAADFSGSRITLPAQGPQGVELRCEVGSFDLEPLTLDGETLQKVILPPAMLPRDAGTPDLPGLSRFVAVPVGASATIEILSANIQTFSGIAVAPAPVIPAGNDDSPLIYARDPAVYSRDAFYPPSPVQLSEVRKMRGVDFIIVGITPFQYNPVTGELIVYTDLELRVDFNGSHGEFGENRLRNRFWEPLLARHLINYDSLPRIDFASTSPDREGHEYVIITPTDSAFVAWGDTLRSWRQLQGIRTGVYTTADIGGSTALEIDAWLSDAYTNWEVPPVAFLVLGDYPGSGDRDTGVTSMVWDGYCVSDNMFADVDGDDLPDMFHGRITARTAGELETMIGKMLTYERQPCTEAPFYDHPIMAGGWQTERWFILCTEIIYGHQAHVLGKDPLREYAIYSGIPGSIWSTNSNTQMIVDYFGPDGLGYIPATPEHLTDWGGNALRLNAGINAGAYLLMHRDHGLESGWGEPDYGIEDLSGLTNEDYPYVFSINCLTGKYNWSAECFAEAFHRSPHGALGVMAASEVSYSFVNDTFVWGLFDTLWPDFMPDLEIPVSVPHGSADSYPAVAMVAAKYFLEGSSWPSNPNSKTVTYHLFHHHGDTFMRLYSEVPRELNVFHYETCPLNTDQFAFQADAGAVVALTVDGEIIGVAEATGEPQTMLIEPQAAPGTLRITATRTNCLRYDVRIPIGGTAYLITADGTGDFPTIQAAIDAAPDGVIIELADGIYTGAGNRDLDCRGKALTIRSQNGDPAACVIDAAGSPAEPHRGFLFTTGEGPATLIAGLQVRGGFSDADAGAGIRCTAASPTFRRIWLSGNQVDGGPGGGIACLEGAAPLLENCRLEINSAAGGGGLYALASSPRLADCLITENSAAAGGGGVWIGGAAGSVELSTCTFIANSSTAQGGGVAVADSATVSLLHCTFYDDYAIDGSALAVLGTGEAVLENTIIAFGRLGAAVHCAESATATLTCCDLYGNEGGDWVGAIAGQYGVVGNISDDPYFCDIASGALTIHSTSACAPEANVSCGLIGAWPVGCWPAEYSIAPDGSGDFATIQDAIDACWLGDQILLEDGVYVGEGNRDLDTQGKPIVIRSAGGEATACIIDCQGSYEDPHRGFVFQSGEGPGTRIENLTVRHAYDTDSGAAMVCTNGSAPTLSGCILTDNRAVWAGAAMLCVDSSPTVSGCSFLNNRIDGEGSAAALECRDGAPAFSSCTFYGNEAWAGGSVIRAQYAAAVTLENSLIAFNSSSLAEPPIVCNDGASVSLACCDVYGNIGGDWTGCIAGQQGTAGNISADPLFCEPDAGDFSIRDDSPCAPEYNPDCGLIGAWPVGCRVPVVVHADGSGQYPTIQAAINAVSDGAVVELTDGVYRGPGNRDIDFAGKEIILRSQSGNTPACVIDCEGSEAQPRRGFLFDSQEGPATMLQNVTIFGGYQMSGGGIYMSNASPTIEGCVMAGNSAMGGGAVYITNGGHPLITACTLVDNAAPTGAGLFLITQADPAVDRTIIAFSSEGQAVFGIPDCEPVLSCCNIYGNAGGDWTGIIEGQQGLNDNFSADPLFCDPAGGDYALDFYSPCAAENNAACGRVGALDVGCGNPSAGPEEGLPTRLHLAIGSPSSPGQGTRFAYAIPGPGAAPVALKVYDLAGRLVHTLTDERHLPGAYRLTWTGTDDQGATVASGVYFARLICRGEERVRSLVLVR